MKRGCYKNPTMGEILAAEYKRCRKDFPSILGIYECIPTVYEMDPDDLIAAHCRGWERQFWSTEDTEYEDHTREYKGGNFCGHVSMVRKGDEERPVVFLLAKYPASEKNLRSASLLGELVHELGHVDDIVNGVNLRHGIEIDTSAAEEYAHHFACNRIMAISEDADSFARRVLRRHLAEWRHEFQRLMKVLMAYYAGEILTRLSDLSVPSIAEAAQRVVASPEFGEYRAFAGEHW